MSLVRATLKTVRHTCNGIEYEFSKGSYRDKAQILADACRPHRERLVTDLRESGINGSAAFAKLRELAADYDDEDDFERVINGVELPVAFRHVLKRTYPEASDADLDGTVASIPFPEQLLIVAKAFNMVIGGAKKPNPPGGSSPTDATAATTSPESLATGTASEPASLASTPA